MKLALILFSTGLLTFSLTNSSCKGKDNKSTKPPSDSRPGQTTPSSDSTADQSEVLIDKSGQDKNIFKFKLFTEIYVTEVLSPPFMNHVGRPNPGIPIDPNDPGIPIDLNENSGSDFLSLSPYDCNLNPITGTRNSKCKKAQCVIVKVLLKLRDQDDDTIAIDTGQDNTQHNSKNSPPSPTLPTHRCMAMHPMCGYYDDLNIIDDDLKIINLKDNFTITKLNHVWNLELKLLEEDFTETKAFVSQHEKPYLTVERYCFYKDDPDAFSEISKDHLQQLADYVVDIPSGSSEPLPTKPSQLPKGGIVFFDEIAECENLSCEFNVDLTLFQRRQVNY